jgi:hypothetical protein
VAGAERHGDRARTHGSDDRDAASSPRRMRDGRQVARLRRPAARKVGRSSRRTHGGRPPATAW